MRFATCIVMALLCVACDEGATARGLMPWQPSIAHAAVTPEAVAPPAAPPACKPVGELDVLFIGNSYVILNDTPGVLAKMAEDAGVRMHVERSAMGGKAFDFHVKRAKTRTALAARPWDVVVLQSHSLDPLRNAKSFAADGTTLIERVRAIGAEPMLFETWPRKVGHNLYNYMDETGGSPDAMLEAVASAYATLGDATGTAVLPVGHAWATMVANHPAHDPYADDGAHPGSVGAYLSAAVLFTVLTERDPQGVVQPHDVSPEAAAAALRVAADTVKPPCTWAVTSKAEALGREGGAGG
ncbi:MAG: DUF4886 domain-containing protein [Myxococcota bacterium]